MTADPALIRERIETLRFHEGMETITRQAYEEELRKQAHEIIDIKESIIRSVGYEHVWSPSDQCWLWRKDEGALLSLNEAISVVIQYYR